ncbi:acetyl xylan esterase [Trametes versicolor FP-101664 SS1]|uniref:acetyl xylan esterase n=1 Tax=Trametes versicolor (strain FP-101664) TaxID=717944 RepID=UPI0004624468|nr:acetyl xylan esterase [Trametes versicolor FP-101664 SS1]EIW63589.1 acetyl xylan esterase [Trametes versicolor FP-101664 SS1]
MLSFKTVFSFAALLPFAHLVAAQSAVWGQCGGIGWTGATTCVSGSACIKQNDYYSQCQPSAASPPVTTVTPTLPPSSPTSTTPTGSAPSGLSTIPASQLFKISNFGPNPNNVAVYVYKPARVQSKPPLIVASHFCTGTAQAYFSGSKFAQLAETYGYVVLFPSSPHSGTCWDVSSDATLTHDGGSDSLGIASAARYALANWGVDPARVFAVGTSSGAMMTNVLAGAYPDVFKGGVVDSGVPFGCFALPGQAQDSWNAQCAQGQLVLTGAQWAQRVLNAYPGYTGARPKMQVWHGTADTTLYPQNFFETVKQWTTVFGYPSTPLSNVSESYLPRGYSNATYGPNFQAILAQGVGHTVPLYEQQYLQFLGIA